MRLFCPKLSGGQRVARPCGEAQQEANLSRSLPGDLGFLLSRKTVCAISLLGSETPLLPSWSWPLFQYAFPHLHFAALPSLLHTEQDSELLLSYLCAQWVHPTMCLSGVLSATFLRLVFGRLNVLVKTEVQLRLWLGMAVTWDAPVRTNEAKKWATDGPPVCL